MGNYEEEVIIRSYDPDMDRIRVECLERRCDVGHNKNILIFTDTLGDPICRIRNSPLHNMLVAEVGNELVGMIQGSIKLVTVHDNPSSGGCNLAKVGYVLGLRVAPLHRRRAIGSVLVRKLEEWFAAKGAVYAYMATQKDNEPSLRLFVHKLGYIRFRTPTILVNPVNHAHILNLPSSIVIQKLKIEEAELRYRRFMASLAEFFPDDIGRILRNKLSLGTWVAYTRGDEDGSWAMLSVWNSGELFKLRVGKAPMGCLLYTKSSRFFGRYLSCLGLPTLPDFFNPFGFYFIYGIHREGPSSGNLVRVLCKYVHNLATCNRDCKLVVTEVGGNEDSLRSHIPHWKLLSCPEDLWCIKALKQEGEKGLNEMIKMPLARTISLFVDPREV